MKVFIFFYYVYQRKIIKSGNHQPSPFNPLTAGAAYIRVFTFY